MKLHINSEHNNQIFKTQCTKIHVVVSLSFSAISSFRPHMFRNTLTRDLMMNLKLLLMKVAVNGTKTIPLTIPLKINAKLKPGKKIFHRAMSPCTEFEMYAQNTTKWMKACYLLCTDERYLVITKLKQINRNEYILKIYCNLSDIFTLHHLFRMPLSNCGVQLQH